jgi:hypothetical protein
MHRSLVLEGLKEKGTVGSEQRQIKAEGTITTRRQPT